ncbi:hypothetical protein BE21_10510 [Sorangium cellulosum]|uniref:Rhs family protein n=1 Tax=Sorangium cellulosum TaxID=56 RepID=A0A150U189_SORCE|nr:hypothetical protein BE21_10510 [Sorangium cellulosum]
MGNLLRMVHQAGAVIWTRWYAYEAANNRLMSTTGDPEHGPFRTYAHDAHGNMTSMPHITALTWDENDQVRSTDLGGGGDVYYDYDAAGQRVRKVWEHSGLVSTAGSWTSASISAATRCTAGATARGFRWSGRRCT